VRRAAHSRRRAFAWRSSSSTTARPFRPPTSCGTWTSRRRTTARRPPERAGWSRARAQSWAGSRTHPVVGFCDDDDMWAPTKAAEQIIAAGTDAGWTCSSADDCRRASPAARSRARADPTTASSRLLAANVVPGGASSVIARTELARAVDGFDPALSALPTGLLGPVAQEAPLAAVARPLVAYLVRAHSMSTDTRLLDEDVRRFRQKHAAARTARNVAFDEGNWRSYVAEMHLRDGRRFRAAGEYVRAVRSGNLHAGRLAAASSWRRRGRTHDFGTVAVRVRTPSGSPTPNAGCAH